MCVWYSCTAGEQLAAPQSQTSSRSVVQDSAGDCHVNPSRRGMLGTYKLIQYEAGLFLSSMRRSLMMVPL